MKAARTGGVLHPELRIASHNLLKLNCQAWGREWLRDILRDVEAISLQKNPIVIAVQEALSWKCGKLANSEFGRYTNQIVFC